MIVGVGVGDIMIRINVQYARGVSPWALWFAGTAGGGSLGKSFQRRCSFVHRAFLAFYRY